MTGLILWWSSLVLTAAACLYLLLAIAAVALHRQRRGPGSTDAPRITLLKPLCGYEIGLEAALESFLTQATNFPIRFVFGVADADDPALERVRAVAARFPHHQVEFVVDAAVRGRNPKVSNLINMAERGLDDIVVISDSDTMIAPGVLQAAIDALATPGTGAATTLYRARPSKADNRIQCFGAWYLDYWDLPTQMLYARLASPSATYGPLTAIRRDVLEQIGGLYALADHLCDDAELGRLVRAAGHDIAFTPAVAETLVNDDGARQLFKHELRWARTTRGITSSGYAASIVTNIGPIPLLLMLHPGLLVCVAMLAPTLLRWLLMKLVVHRFGKAAKLPTPGLFNLWLRDCACFAIWVTGFTVGEVSWRGTRLLLHSGDVIRGDLSLSEQLA